jgi:hypothetical protein
MKKYSYFHKTVFRKRIDCSSVHSFRKIRYVMWLIRINLNGISTQIRHWVTNVEITKRWTISRQSNDNFSLTSIFLKLLMERVVKLSKLALSQLPRLVVVKEAIHEQDRLE